MAVDIFFRYLEKFSLLGTVSLGTYEKRFLEVIKQENWRASRGNHYFLLIDNGLIHVGTLRTSPLVVRPLVSASRKVPRKGKGEPIIKGENPHHSGHLVCIKYLKLFKVSGLVQYIIVSHNDRLKWLEGLGMIMRHHCSCVFHMTAWASLLMAISG